jgi:hypothetical protein
LRLSSGSMTSISPGNTDSGGPIRPKTAGQARASRRWNGWPPCVCTSQTGASQWSDITAITATSHGENGKKKTSMTAFPVSSIRAILKHLGLWLVRSRPPPKTHDPPVFMHKTGRPAAPYIMDDLCCKLPLNDDHLYSDPEYSCDQYIQT